MSSLNLDLDYFDHPKTKRLVCLLGKGAESLPLRLWCYCGKYHCQDGELAGYSMQEVESIVGWWGKAGAMVDAMLKLRFMDETQNGFRVHDWIEHAGHIYAFKIRSQKMNEAKLEKARNEHSPPARSPPRSPARTPASNSASEPIALQCNAITPPTPSGGEGTNGRVGRKSKEERNRQKILEAR